MEKRDEVKNVLVVDDEANIRQLAALILESAGYKVFEALDGNEALHTLNRYDIRIVITDLRMPHMNGIELTRNLRRKPAYRQLPVVMMTSGFNGYKKREGEEAGVTDWISKAYMHQQLLPLVKRFTD